MLPQVNINTVNIFYISFSFFLCKWNSAEHCTLLTPGLSSFLFLMPDFFYLLIWPCWVFAAAWTSLQSWCGGSSRCGSQVLEHRLSSCGARAPLLRSMSDLPGSGIKPMSPARQVDSLPLSHQESPQPWVLLPSPLPRATIKFWICSQQLLFKIMFYMGIWIHKWYRGLFCMYFNLHK